MARTYLPTLVRIVYTLCVYNARWGVKIRPNLPEGVLPYYDALTVACDEFLEAVGVLPVNP
jgi:hypothetical protein